MRESDTNDELQQEGNLHSTKRWITFQKIGQLLRHRWPEYVLEIFVVIIGITISLALNNVQQNTSNNKLEHVYLTGLSEDILSDIAELEETIRQTEKVIQSGQLLLQQSRTDSITFDKKKFINLVRSIVERPNFTSKNATFSALKSSANFHLINDIKLKNLLFDYDMSYQALKTVEFAELHATVSIVAPYIIKYIPLSDSKRSANVPMKLDIQNILSDIQFTNSVVLRLDTRVELLRNYTEILKTAHQIKKTAQENLTNF